MTFTHDDGEPGNYYLPCGCWSGQSDHTCMVDRSRCRGCGCPDDCMCHEMCDDPAAGNACADCVRDHRESVDEDHAEAIREDRNRRDGDEDEAVRRLVIGHRPRVVTLQAYDGNGNPVILPNGRRSWEFRPRDCVDRNARLAATRFARVILRTMPDVRHVQMWDVSGGTRVWGMGDNENGRWFVAYPTHEDGDPTPITRVRNMWHVDGSGN